MYRIENNNIVFESTNEACGHLGPDETKIIPAGEWMYASWEAINKVANEGYSYFVWPNDGEIYNEPGDVCEPLMIDGSTAHAMIAVHNALNEKNQVHFKEEVKRSRLHFGRLVELCWSKVRFR